MASRGRSSTGGSTSTDVGTADTEALGDAHAAGMGLTSGNVVAGIESVAAGQGGVVSRQQLRDAGISREIVRQQLRARRWQRAFPGAYVLFTGPLPPVTRVWAALMYAGENAIASHRTAAWLDGLVDAPPDRVDALVPHGRRQRKRGSRPGVRVRQTRHLDQRRHPASLPLARGSRTPSWTCVTRRSRPSESSVR